MCDLFFVNISLPPHLPDKIMQMKPLQAFYPLLKNTFIPWANLSYSLHPLLLLHRPFHHLPVSQPTLHFPLCPPLPFSPLLSLTCSYYKGAQMPQIFTSDLLQQKGDPRGIHLTNHCLKPLRAHRPRDKDSRELYSALAGLSDSLSGMTSKPVAEVKNRRWPAYCALPFYLSISLSEKFHQNLWNKHKGMSPLS